VTLTKRDMQKNDPELTLDMAVRLLRTAFAKPTLSEQEAIDLVDYYRKRNRVARDSHRKSWLRKHKTLAKRLVLQEKRQDFSHRGADAKSLLDEALRRGREERPRAGWRDR
jgi:hypothetical protein